MRRFICPFCGMESTITPYDEKQLRHNFLRDKLPPSTQEPHILSILTRCPRCRRDSLRIAGMQGYLDSVRSPVYPAADYRRYPTYIPEAIRSDYQEACAIRELCPKASAALTRRCLQGMIRDRWKVKPANLNQEINAIKPMIPGPLWDAIDALRQLGNIGAHMEKDVSLIVDIDPGEAGRLLDLVELLLDEWYVREHESGSLYRDILGINAAKQRQRKPPHSP